MLSAVLTAVTLPVLAVAGAAAGLLSATCAGWLTRYWEAGAAAQVSGAVGMAALLGILYCLCRLCAWGARSVLGGAAFALGFTVMTMVLTGYLPGGDIVLTAHTLNYVYLYGAMAVMAIAVVRGLVKNIPHPAGPPPVTGDGRG